MRTINLVLTKEAFKVDASRADACVIVLDIIFATSSIVAALQAGARHVYPAHDLAEAEQISQTLTPGSWILAGEDNARAFEGYHSFEPLALSDPVVAGKDIVYATTNGTIALRKAAAYQYVYAASLANASAVVEHMLDTVDADTDIIIVCAGSRGRFSLEDFYGAGCLVQVLQRHSSEAWCLGDAARAALLAWENTDPFEVLRQTRMANIMTDMGLGKNIEAISQVDTSTVVSFYDGRILYNAN